MIDVQEICQKLKPIIGKKAEQYWLAYLTEDTVGKKEMADILQLIALQVLGMDLENPKVHLSVPSRTSAEGEYPIGSENWYTAGERGGCVWVGADRGGHKFLVSTASHEPNYDFFPSAADWDTIWVVGRGETVDIPYWPNYTALADQDFVCRYSDDNLDISYGLGWGRHLEPLYLDMIQTSHAWSVPPAENWILYQFYIIPKKTKNYYFVRLIVLYMLRGAVLRNYRREIFYLKVFVIRFVLIMLGSL